MKCSLSGTKVISLLFTAGIALAVGCLEKERVVDTSITSVGPEFDFRTTAPEIATSNLIGQVEALEQIMNSKPRELSPCQQLVGALLTKTQFFATYDDFQKALDIAEKSVLDFPKDADAYLLRARVLSTLHRFGEVVKDIDSASKLSSNSQTQKSVEDLRQTIQIAIGADLLGVRESLSKAVKLEPSFANFLKLAAVESELGEFNSADLRYADALRAYHDVSPFPVAYVAFQRGVMWAEKADHPQRATLYYEEAIRRLPSYVGANVHLAKQEAETRDTSKAIERMKRTFAESKEPEAAAVLADVLARQGEAAASEATLFRDYANKGFEKLLGSYEEAFRDHGAGYYLDGGSKPDLAYKLARANLEVRKNDRAFLLAIEAALASGQIREACMHMIEVRARGIKNEHLKKTVATLSAECS